MDCIFGGELATFSHEEKNDFSNWVREIIKDGPLARELSRAKNKEDAHTITLKRLLDLS